MVLKEVYSLKWSKRSTITDVIVICEGNERVCLSRVRTSSCQSDSSGFLEEPFVPAYPNPGPELMKVKLTTANSFCSCGNNVFQEYNIFAQ